MLVCEVLDGTYGPTKLFQIGGDPRRIDVCDARSPYRLKLRARYTGDDIVVWVLLGV